VLKLFVTPKAESDLTNIWLYTCNKWGGNQADNYLDQLEAGINQLINHPSLGANYTHVLPEYRRLLVEHYAVFYKVLKQEICIVRVLHEDMDAPQRLLD
jgi:toxin ParE1/3/4